MTDLAVRPSDVVEGQLAEYRTPEEWGVIVRADLGQSVQGVIDAGRHLREAKAQIEHGQWEKWLDAEVGITRPTANRLMLVAGHPTISNRSHANGLPSSWDTLYQLSQLKPAQLEAAIIDGEVTPALERKQAKALVARYRIEPVSAPPVSAPPAPSGLVSTIVADPPWRYGNTVTRAAAEDHYPTMSIDELRELPVARDRAADDAHLYLWTTAGHLPEAFRVMEAWGFEYKTYLVWAKPQMGMGNYFRVSTELVLFGVRGRLPVEDRGIKNWFEARRGRHSKKPEEFLRLVERASPGPYLEMFSRCSKSGQLICGCAKCQHGWEVWGNQA
jgi:N6-adenosine-specific RNA methylase IME4